MYKLYICLRTINVRLFVPGVLFACIAHYDDVFKGYRVQNNYFAELIETYCD